MFESERSAYPHPDEFTVIRPEYLDPEEDEDDVIAIISHESFRVTGNSATRAGARRAALYEAAKTYRNYHPSYRVESPFPNEFADQNGTTWKRIPEHLRDKNGDYEFADADGEDYADIDQMLLWDIRPAPVVEEDVDE
ncbi:MAG: hypothetical protein IIC18_00090 [Bacteroidetes bacterium]|nr:hypothetical protein [Bacteroidota bacterium]